MRTCNCLPFETLVTVTTMRKQGAEVINYCHLPSNLTRNTFLFSNLSLKPTGVSLIDSWQPFSHTTSPDTVYSNHGAPEIASMVFVPLMRRSLTFAVSIHTYSRRIFFLISESPGSLLQPGKSPAANNDTMSKFRFILKDFCLLSHKHNSPNCECQ